MGFFPGHLLMVMMMMMMMYYSGLSCFCMDLGVRAACPAVQVTDCNIDTTSATINSVFQLSFVVTDNSGYNASVVRTITVTNPCSPPRGYLCDGQCSTVDCAAAAQLQQLSGATNASTPAVYLVLLPGVKSNFSEDSGRNKTLHLVYGQVPPISLYPCASSNQSELGTCAAAARNSAGQDLSNQVLNPVDVTPCDANATACIRCGPAMSMPE